MKSNILSKLDIFLCSFQIDCLYLNTQFQFKFLMLLSGLPLTQACFKLKKRRSAFVNFNFYKLIEGFRLVFFFETLSHFSLLKMSQIFLSFSLGNFPNFMPALHAKLVWILIKLCFKLFFDSFKLCHFDSFKLFHLYTYFVLTLNLQKKMVGKLVI